MQQRAIKGYMRDNKLYNPLSLLSINFHKIYLEYLLLPFPSFYFIGWNFINILKPQMSYCHVSYKPFPDTLWNQISSLFSVPLWERDPGAVSAPHSLVLMPLRKHLLQRFDLLLTNWIYQRWRGETHVIASGHKRQTSQQTRARAFPCGCDEMDSQTEEKHLPRNSKKAWSSVIQQQGNEFC